MSDWTQDETLGTLVDIFDRADGETRMRLAGLARRSEEAARKYEEAVYKYQDAVRKYEAERARCEVLDRDVARLSTDLHRLQSSLSWRVTKPLRTFRFAIGALLHPPGDL